VWVCLGRFWEKGNDLKALNNLLCPGGFIAQHGGGIPQRMTCGSLRV
jgi:hypothetical protein